MKKKIYELFNNLSVREKFLAVGGTLVLALILLDALATPLLEKSKAQQLRLKKVQDNLALLPNQLEKYQNLFVRQQKIEKEFQEVSFKGGVLSHLEELIRTKAKVDNPTNYKINPLPEKPFSNDYRQEPFRVELFTTSETDLKNFLNELVNGERPLVLSRIDIKKAPNQSRLIVQLDISNFQKV
ncbi:MAG: hypothetical protein WD512_20005 [Candidatus Paceibacterota bacterium]